MEQREGFERALIASTEILCENFHIDYSYPFFRHRELITQDEQEEIKAQTTRSARTLRFIEILLRRDAQAAFYAIHEFIASSGGQEFLIQFLDHVLDNFKSQFRQE